MKSKRGKSKRQANGYFAARWFGWILVVLLVAPLISHADTATLPALKDTTLYEPEIVTNDAGNGSGQYTFTGVTKNGLKRRAVISFDIAAVIPADATIEGAELTLNVAKVPNPLVSAATSLPRISENWG